MACTGVNLIGTALAAIVVLPDVLPIVIAASTVSTVVTVMSARGNQWRRVGSAAKRTLLHD